ncbi:MAG: SLC13 family permease [Thermodesulfobacteria bacterium]|nr:SLC13 family permease [Thermodesulfobacteriota bacterium]
MTNDIMIVLGVLAFAILLFIFEWVRVDVVGIMMMVLLPLLGVVTPKQAISGLSSNAVVSIIAVIIIGAGLDKTGVMNILARQIIKLAGKSETRIMALIAATVGLISSFMQNIGAAALFMPAATRISKQLGVPISRILMPMGFCAIIGGCITLVGSSPLILLNDLMESWWNNNISLLGGKAFEPFGLFTVTPMGLALLAAGILYFALLGKWILPATEAKDSGLMSRQVESLYSIKVGKKPFELEVPEDWTPKSLDELNFRPTYRATIVGIFKPSKKKMVLSPVREDVIEPGDDVAVFGREEDVKKAAKDLGWKIKDDLEYFAEMLSPNNCGIVEAVIPPNSKLVGTTLRDLHFRKTFGVNPLALNKGGEIIRRNISRMKLRAGDGILLLGPWEKLHFLKKKGILLFTEDLKGELMRPHKAIPAIACLVLALTLALGFHVQLSIALLTGALGMVLLKVLSIDEAYQSVDWMTVFLLGGLIPLGLAFETTGAARYIATSIMNAMGQVTPFTLLLIIGLLTSFFTLVASNVGATVLLVPLSMNMALQAGADPRMAALVVGIAASNTFVLPTHQVNALIMRPGGYKTIDYVRAGTGMTIIYLVVMMAMLYFYYGISG